MAAVLLVVGIGIPLLEEAAAIVSSDGVCSELSVERKEYGRDAVVGGLSMVSLAPATAC